MPSYKLVTYQSAKGPRAGVVVDDKLFDAAALTRKAYEGARDERLTLIDVLHAYTAGGAWAAKLEGVTGTLRVGMAADLVLIDGDIEAMPATEVGHTGIALTVSGGRITHQVPGIA